MQEWNEVKLFISSTFNDMHAERDYLVTEVFPELREWCEARRLRLTDIDLRWGISKDQPETEDTVRTCLRCIDECRPFFLCFVGQRRGWIPDLEKYSAGNTEYEGLSAHLDRSSITEIEIEHAALAPMMHILSDKRERADKCNALFFFREDPFTGKAGKKETSIFRGLFSRSSHVSGSIDCNLTDAQRRIYTNAGTEDESAEDEKLEALRQRIYKEWPVHSYRCRWDAAAITEELRSLGDVCQGRLTDFSCDGMPLRDTILSALKAAIVKEYPEHVPVSEPDPYDEDALEQHLFAQMSCFDFTGRSEYLESIRSYAETDSDGDSLLLFGEEGVGKTALLSKLWHELDGTGKKIVFRSCGVTDASVSESELYLSIGNECGMFRASEKDPSLRKQIDTVFLSNMLEQGFDTLILDGAEQLTGRNELRSIGRIPTGFHLILSSNRQQDIDSLHFPKKVIRLSGISDLNERISLVKTFLKRSLKSLSYEQMNLLVSSEGADNPLYLKTVCSELISYGSHAGLTDKIKCFGDSLEDAFLEVLRTVENECQDNRRLFPLLCGLLGFGRGGLDEVELLRAFGKLGYAGEDTRYRIRMILRRLRPYLSRANGRFDFPFYSLRNAACIKYRDLERQLRQSLVFIYLQNLGSAPVPSPNGGVVEVHGSRELLYQYVMLGDEDGLRDVLQRDSLLNRIPPAVYFSEYKNGGFYYCDQDSDQGYGIGCVLLAELFLKKAISNKDIIGRFYPHPYRSKCMALRERSDQTEFFRFRDLFYELTQYATSSMRLITCAARSIRSVDDYYALKAKLNNLITNDSGIFSMMDYLSNFGAHETGLSHQIEDLADGALLARQSALEAISEMPKFLVET